MSCKTVLYFGNSTQLTSRIEGESELELVKIQQLAIEDSSMVDDSSSVLLIDETLFFSEDVGKRVSDFKKKYPFVPIIAVAEGGSNLIGKTLAQGAVDYVSADLIGLSERLSYRCDEVLNRKSGEKIDVGDLVLDTFSRSIYGEKGQRSMSPTEMSLLKTLALAKGHVVDRSIIKRECWGSEDSVSDNALNRKLHEVRRAVNSVSDSVTIKTVYGQGFKLDLKAGK